MSCLFYASKWNPIEHRLFPHVSRAMSGVVLESYHRVKELIENTHTECGLKITANIIDKIYQKGKKDCAEIYETGTIIFDQDGNTNKITVFAHDNPR